MLNINSRVTLNNGRPLPRLGLGVWRVGDMETAQVVGWALEAGYRLIDTASYYQNENSVGRALKESAISRNDFFVTSKVWNDSQGYENTLRSCGRSLERLGLDYLDLYLVHWPVGGPELVVETWRAMEKIYREGLARSIGVSNFTIRQLEDLIARAEVKPALNQVELHPLMTQEPLRKWCAQNGIRLEAYAPLARGRCLDAQPITVAAAKYDRTPAQIILRWQLQNDIVVIPKSVHRQRIFENADLYGFNLTDDELAVISALNRDQSVLSTVFPQNEESYVII